MKGNTANFLSYNTAQKLNVVTISVNTATVTAMNNNSPEVLQEEIRCLFGCIGKIRNKMVKLHVDPDVTPKNSRTAEFLFMFVEMLKKSLRGWKD